MKRLFISLLACLCVGTASLAVSSCAVSVSVQPVPNKNSSNSTQANSSSKESSSKEVESSSGDGDSSYVDNSSDNEESASEWDESTSEGEESLIASEGLEYTLSDDGLYYIVTGIGSCEDTELVIPSAYNNLPVTTIGDYAFEDCSGLTSVVIGDSVTKIGDGAFYNCTSLTSVVIGDSVTTIGADGFGYCEGLTAVYLTDIAAWCNITFEDRYANPLYRAENLYLNGERVTELVIPDEVSTIGNYTFSYCKNVTSVVIGDSVMEIEGEAFVGCYKLVEVYNKSSLTITQGSEEYGYVGYYAKNIYTLTSGESKLSNDNGYLIYTDGEEKILIEYTGDETDLVLPSYITQIHQDAFYNCSSLTSVVIGDSVTSIGDYAFYACDSLKSVAIGDGVTTIGEKAFYACKKLTRVYYKGTAYDWSSISIEGEYNYYLTNATRYYYSETVPTNGGNYWHYDQNGEIAIW